MANYDVSIYAELHMVEINTKEGLDIIIPINVDEACQIFKGKRFEVVSATSDCNMDLSYEDGSKDPIRLIWDLSTLNTLSNYEEVNALVECGITKLDDVLRIVKSGNYHFYTNSKQAVLETLYEEVLDHCWSDIEDEEELEYRIDELEYEGYFVCSDGILYLPDSKKITRDETTALNETWEKMEKYVDAIKYKYHPKATLKQIVENLKGNDKYCKDLTLKDIKSYGYVKTSTGVVHVKDKIMEEN